MRRSVARLIVGLALLAPTLAEAQRSIGNWSGSSRSWNHSAMSTVRSTMLARGHTVHANAAMTAANLALYDVFIVGEASPFATAAEIAALSTWVNAGGRLVMLWDSSNSGNPAGNAILSGLGSTMSVGPGSASGPCSPFLGGNFATEGPPYNLVGAGVTCSPGTKVNGGATLLTDYIHFEQRGAGYVYAFADRLDHNVFAPTAGNNNGKLFINIVEGKGSDPGVVPEPGSIVLMATGLFGTLVVAHRRRKK